MQEIIHARMKENKLKLANQNTLQQQIQSFNEESSAEPNRIADHNDPYRIEWLDPTTLPSIVYGEAALQLPLEVPGFQLFYPMAQGELNTVDYHSLEAGLQQVAEDPRAGRGRR